MAERSKRISFDIPRDKINKESVKFFNKYKIDMSIKELSEKTIYNYEMDLFAWFSYVYMFQDNKSILEVDEDDLTEYFYYRKSEGNNTRRLKRIMSSISAMYLYLKKKKISKENPMEFIDRPRKDNDVVVQTFLTQEQVDLMLTKLKEFDLQIETYVVIGLSTMARVNALSNIKWKQIDWENMSVNGVLEKEGYIVDLDFDEYSKELLLRLKKEREEKGIDCEYVFISLYDKKYSNVTNSTCNDWCKKIGKLIGVPTFHNHDLRHSGATILKNNGAKLEDISKMLNHSSTDVTLKHYIKEDSSKLKESKAKFGALRNVDKLNLEEEK